jgi:hypothetical protein
MSPAVRDGHQGSLLLFLRKLPFDPQASMEAVII